jgi:hypothetical protein
MDFVDQSGESFVGFVREGGGDDLLHASPSRGFGEQTRVSAVAGDDPERVWRWPISQQEITEVTEVLKFKPSVFSVSSC